MTEHAEASRGETKIASAPAEGAAVAAVAGAARERPVVLRTAGLRRTFGTVTAVAGLDLSVREGEIYGFLGVNGAGKTTTIRMLMGILKPDAGTIELLGQVTRRTTVKQKQAIGYVSQEQTFYPWMTGRELGRFVGALYQTWDAAEYARLLQVLEVPPDRRVSQLSGGMRVKLALALALAPRPALLILDEPTSGLDPLARREFLEIIQRQSRHYGRTTLFSSHIVGEVERVAERVGMIHQGAMRYEGGIDSLRKEVRRVRWAGGAGGPGGATEAGGCPDASGVSAGAVAPPVPGGFEVLRREWVEEGWTAVLRGPAARWEESPWEGGMVSAMTLEDIFIALVGGGGVGI